ncbi:MAG TPA: hypothetical protein VFG30_36030, partial [Polyangiales bacterium]|nr:hypothetical protein [Polyangiales bacterium]
MRLVHTTLLVTMFLGALSGCGAQPAAEEGQLPAFSSISNGLVNRPANPRCIAPTSTQVPQMLSRLNCFDSIDPALPGPSMVPYDVVASLWADDADKARWFAVPDGATISVDQTGRLLLPRGSMLFKTFALAGQRLETRVWMNHSDTGWSGYSYRWDPGAVDAVLAGQEDEHVAVAGSSETWTIPGRGQCARCHVNHENPNLGFQLAQLDRDFTYPTTGRSANQLGTLRAIGLLELPIEPTAGAQLVDYRDEAQPLAARARSYLHANCSSCHYDATGYCTGDLRITAPDKAMGLCN